MHAPKAVGLSVLAALSVAVVRRDLLAQFDHWLIDAIQSRLQPSVYLIAQAFSALASPPFVIALGVGVGSLLALRRQGLLLGGWAAAVLGGQLLNAVLKRMIQRPRPLDSEILSSESWSFPSGHAMTSLVLYGMLVYLLLAFVPTLGRQRIVVVACAALLIVAIGSSRLYIGVHYFSDVLGGYAVGMVWLSACIWGLEVARRSRAEQQVRIAESTLKSAIRNPR